MQVTGQEFKAECGTEQLAVGVEEGTEGGIHAIRLLWEHYYQEEDWVFIFIDAQNSFNEENQTAMIWDVQYEWPSGMQFIFNYYRHWATLGVQNLEGLCHFLHIREVVTQGGTPGYDRIWHRCPPYHPRAPGHTTSHHPAMVC